MHIYRSVSVFVFILMYLQFTKIEHVDASFWDGVLGASQIKSLFQLVGGHKKSAAQTQKNFLNQMVGISQFKSIVHAITLDFDKAKRTQKIFYHKSVEPLLDNTPGVGHAKAAIHFIAGNSKRGVEVLKDSSRAAAAVVGATLGKRTNL